MSARLQEYAPGQVTTSSIWPAPAFGEVQLEQRGINLRKARQRNKREQQILIDGHAYRSIARGGCQLRDAAELIRGEVALVHLHDGSGVAGLPLLDDVGGEPGIERGVAGAGLIHDRQQRAIA